MMPQILIYLVVLQAGVSACNRVDPLDETLPVPSALSGADLGLKYQGDVVGFTRLSRVLPRLSERGGVALLRLANAKVFTTPGIGSAGSLSPYAHAFRNVLKEPVAAAAFAELLKSPEPAAQLYGLSGLYLLDRPAYQTNAERLRKESATVVTLIGCIQMEERVASVVGAGTPDRWEIANGYWPKALAVEQ